MIRDGSLLDTAIKQGVERSMAKAFAPDGWLTKQIRLHVGWLLQGFEPGFDIPQRAAFTATVADRIHEKARRRLTIFGVPLWPIRERREWCDQEAERIVTDWLRDDQIKFGDPRYCWDDGCALADEDMSYWEAA